MITNISIAPILMIYFDSLLAGWICLSVFFLWYQNLFIYLPICIWVQVFFSRTAHGSCVSWVIECLKVFVRCFYALWTTWASQNWVPYLALRALKTLSCHLQIMMNAAIEKSKAILDFSIYTHTHRIYHCFSCKFYNLVRICLNINCYEYSFSGTFLSI